MKWYGYLSHSHTNNNLPDFSFVSLTYESETNVELHIQLKLTNILKFKQHFKI